MTDYSTFLDIPKDEKYRDIRALRYQRQRISANYARELTMHGVKNCMRVVIGGNVHINLSRETGRAFFSGLVTCGSVWDCPICAAKISTRRGKEIKQAKEYWLEHRGCVVMVTYTIRHNKGDRLSDLSRVMTDAIRYVHSGAPYKRIEEKHKIAGAISATEVLYNPVNGWHYHKHQMLFIDSETLDYESLQKWIYARYQKYLNQHGYEIIEGIGVKVSEPEKQNGDQAIEYIAKWGLEEELTHIDKKDNCGITPFQLLDDPELKTQWIEYSKTMRGKRRITWSRGLRDLVGLNEEISDEVLAQEMEAEADQNIEVMDISYREWKYILKHDLRSYILCSVERDINQFYLWYEVAVIKMIDYLYLESDKGL